MIGMSCAQVFRCSEDLTIYITLEIPIMLTLMMKKSSDPGRFTKITFLQSIASQLWDAQVTVFMTFSRTAPNASSRNYFVMNEGARTGLPSYIYYNENTHVSTDCNPTFEDPMDDILKSFRELVLRIAIVDAVWWNSFAAATNSATNTTTLPFAQQTASYKSHQVRVLYVAQTSALVLGAVISLLGPLATMVLFWGWWKLGRDFSMNPLELVNALLVQETGAGTGTGTGKGVGMVTMAKAASNAVVNEHGHGQGHQSHWERYSQRRQQQQKQQKQRTRATARRDYSG